MAHDRNNPAIPAIATRHHLLPFITGIIKDV
jgi:hypothetical protein